MRQPDYYNDRFRDRENWTAILIVGCIILLLMMAFFAVN